MVRVERHRTREGPDERLGGKPGTNGKVTNKSLSHWERVG
jgi:hypothetical protein